MGAVRRMALALASVMVLASCGSNSRKLTKEQVIDYGEIGYADIISFIVQGYQSHWEDMSPEELKLSPVYSYSSPYAGFTRKDIDCDGLDELLIGDLFEDGSYALYDIYGINPKDASLNHLACGGERDRFVINGDGVIIESGSNSADDSFVKGYRIKDGKLVEIDGCWHDTLLKLEFEYFSDLGQPQELCGGYTEQRDPTEEEMALFALATDNNPDLTPLSVSTQVVSGINYRFWCRCKADNDCGHCWVTIYKPFPGQGEPRLTSIENLQRNWDDCGSLK